MSRLHLLLADVTLVLHGLVVLFNLGALPLIWVGYVREWRFVRNPYFRLLHLLLIGLVTAEAALGWECPLTTLEESLRSGGGAGAGYEGGFLSHWLHRLIFWDISPWLWMVLYGLFFALVVASYILVRPHPFRARAWKPKTP